MAKIVMKAVFTDKLHADVAANNLSEAGFKPKQRIFKNKSTIKVELTAITSKAAQEILQDSGADNIKFAK